MKRFLASLTAIVFVVATLVVPASASAQTLSVTQEITITARVLPARSIVVNDKGQMIRIYSNTDENVTPMVYINKAPGEQTALTPKLKKQYQAVLAQHKNLIGIAIEVPLPARPVADTDLSSFLRKTVSIVLIPSLLR